VHSNTQSLWVQFRTAGVCPALFEKCRQGCSFTNILYLYKYRHGSEWIPYFSISNAYKMSSLAASVLIATTCFAIFAVRIMSCLLFSYTLKLSDSLYIINWFFVWRDEIQEAQTTDYCTTSTCSVPTEHTLCKYSVNSWSLNNFRIYAIQVIKTNEHNFSFS
jgi:hypothetical protein